MKKIVSSCLTLLCVVILGLGFSACIVNPAAPEAAGSVGNIDSPTFSLEGDMFTLPFPITELFALGWEFDDDEATIILEPGIEAFESVYLTSGSQNLLVMINNFSGEEQAISEGYITGITAHDVYSNAEIILLGGISLDSTYDEVTAVYEYAQSWTDFENSFILSFFISDFTISLTFDKETNSVTLINMHYSPWL